MTTDEQLLYFVACRPQSVDPVRIMKGLFLFTQAVREIRVAGDHELFDFEPMQYGPCATDVYSALDRFVLTGEVRPTPVPGETWSQFEATESGVAKAKAIAERGPSDAVLYLRQLREWCDNHSFTSLLRAVYARYPDFAAASVLPHLRPNG